METMCQERELGFMPMKGKGPPTHTYFLSLPPVAVIFYPLDHELHMSFPSQILH